MRINKSINWSPTKKKYKSIWSKWLKVPDTCQILGSKNILEDNVLKIMEGRIGQGLQMEQSTTIT